MECFGSDIGVSRDERIANARLIAAAPELLEATRVAQQLADIAAGWNLQEVEIDGEMRSIYDIKDIFRDAIAKATGE